MSAWHEARRFIHLNREHARFAPAYPDNPALRFWEKVEKTEGCWRWLAGLGRDGYGKYLVSRERTVAAHRYAWELTHGTTPTGPLLHSCDNRLCVNPAHLRLGTQQENIADMDARGRRAVPAKRRRLTAEERATILAHHALGVGVRTIARSMELKASTVRGFLIRYHRGPA